MDKTTRLILEAAADEFAEGGYKAAGINDIAGRAGVTTGAIYSRWSSKTDLVVDALNLIFQQILVDQRLAAQTLAAATRSPDAYSDVQGVADADREMGAFELIVALGTSLRKSDKQRDVISQALGSARSNQDVRQCLQRFISEEANQLTCIIDNGKREGLIDSEVSTVALSLLCQGGALGMALLASAGPPGRHSPTKSEWQAVLSRLSSSVARPDEETAQHVAGWT